MAAADQILTVLLSAFVGYGGKRAQDWWTAKKAREEDEALWSLHKQQFRLPLLDAGRQLKARLSELAAVSTGQPSPHTLQSLSGDFRELYLLSRDEIPPTSWTATGTSRGGTTRTFSGCGSACATS